MEDQVKVTKGSLYQQILDKGAEVFKGLNQNVEKKRDKRAFKSAYDNAYEKRDKAVQERNKLYEKIGEYTDNMEKIIKSRTEERQAELTMEFIKDEYMKVFGVEMPMEE